MKPADVDIGSSHEGSAYVNLTIIPVTQMGIGWSETRNKGDRMENMQNDFNDLVWSGTFFDIISEGVS